ncbi:MAG: Clp protease N-terminal domain-containing protein, partial [Acidimicrobiales bacterium]
TSPAARALHDQGATLEGCREKAAEAVGPDGVAGPAVDTRAELPLTDRAKRALERASRLALRRREALVQPGHVLISVLDVEGTAGQVLRRLNVDLAGVQRQLDHPPVAATDPPDDTRPRRAAGPPRCGQCGGALDATLAHRVVRSSGDDGEARDLIVAYCAECGSALGVTPT